VPRSRSALAGAGLGAGTGFAVGVVLRRRAPGSLDRSAHVDRPTTLAGGPVAALGALAGMLLVGDLAALPVLVAAAGSGLLDDLTGTGAHHYGATDRPSRPSDGLSRPGGTGEVGTGEVGGGDPAPVRGLRGHLGRLAHGRMTSGAVKLVAISGGALLSAALLAAPGGPRRLLVPPAGAGRVLADAALLAGTANLVNLFDVRPGRAGKLLALGAAALLVSSRPRGRAPAAVLVGVLAAEAPRDLHGEWMLGDCGANTLGALAGLSLVAGRSPDGRAAWLAVVVTLTLLSERVSFSAVIAGNRVLAGLDRIGTR